MKGICTWHFYQDPRWEKAADDHNDLGFKVWENTLNQQKLKYLGLEKGIFKTVFFQVGGAALMPSIVLNPHAPAEVAAREWRNWSICEAISFEKD